MESQARNIKVDSESASLAPTYKQTMRDIDEQLQFSYQFLIYHALDILNMRTKRNSLAMINRLPTEILTYIFKILAFGTPYVHIERKWNWFNVTYVCHHWRIVGLKIPEIGLNVFDDATMESVERSLKVYNEAMHRLLVTSHLVTDITIKHIDEQLQLSNHCLIYNMAAILNLGAKKNASASINQLPPEVLGYIFTFLAYDYITPSIGIERIWDWIHITHVCHYWRSLSHNIPRMWSHIWRFKDMERTKNAINFSKDADLIVSFAWLFNSSWYPKTYESLVFVLQHMHRISELFIEAGLDFWKTNGDVWVQPAPRLRSLSLHANHRTSFTLPPFPHPAPLLKCLSMRFCTIPQNRCLPQNLTHLTFESVEGFSTSSLLETLQACPDLEHLTVITTKVKKSPWHTIIQLKHLRHLQIHDMDFYICSDLLKYIVLPDNLNWEIYCPCTSTLDEMIKAGIFPQLLRKSIHSETVQVILTEMALSVGTRGTSTLHSAPQNDVKTSLHFQWNINSPESVDEVCSQALLLIQNSCWKSAEMLFVNVDGNSDKVISEKNWTRLLTAFPSVQFLGIAFCGDSVNSEAEREFALALANDSDTPSLKDSNEVALVCTKLDHLSLRYAQFSEVKGGFTSLLGNCLMKRRQRGYGLCKLSIYDGISIKEEHIANLSECAEEVFWDLEEVDSDSTGDESDLEISDEDSDDEVYISDTSEDEEDYDELDQD